MGGLRGRPSGPQPPSLLWFFTVLFWPPPWEFDTFSSHLFLPWFYKKWLKRYTLRYIPQISPEKFRPHCVVFDSGSVWRPSPLTAYHLLKKQQRQEALCFVSPPLSGMVRRHYWSENWLHIYQSNLVDFKSLPYPRQQQVITWLSWCLTYFCLGSISMPLSHLRQQQGSRL